MSPADRSLELFRKAAEQFRFYERNHRAKRTPEAQLKANVNDAMASEIEAHIKFLEDDAA